MQLSPRERQVCELVVRGLSNKEIARALKMSHRTVEDHRMHGMKKFGADNVVKLVRQWYQIPDDATGGEISEVVPQ